MRVGMPVFREPSQDAIKLLKELSTENWQGDRINAVNMVAPYTTSHGLGASVSYNAASLSNS